MDWRGAGGILKHAHTPTCIPISVSQVQRSPVSVAMWPREAAMNSEQQKRAMSGD